MNKPPDERKEERARTGQSWDNEGGGQSPNVPPSEEDESDRKAEKAVQDRRVPLFPDRLKTRGLAVPTELGATYFMKLWNAGTRTVKRHRVSERRNLLSINPDNHRKETVGPLFSHKRFK